MKKMPSSRSWRVWLSSLALGCLTISGGQALAQTLPEVYPLPTKPIQLPDVDLFYKQPDAAVLAGAVPGAVLRFREISAMAYFVLPMGGRAWQLMYRSHDTKGRPVADVTTVIVPSNAPQKGRVLLSFQTAYDGLDQRCAASQEMLRGTADEAGLILPALLKGWVVNLPDYEGPQAQWTAGINAGHGVLDSVRAATSFMHAGLDGMQTPVVMMGYSGGALATTWATELHDSYAPDVNLRGVAVGGVPADLGSAGRHLDGGLLSGIYFAAVAGLARAYPEVDPQALFNDKGLRMLGNIGQMCVGQFMTGTWDPILAYAFQRMSRYTKVPQLLDVPVVQRILAENKLGQRIPSVPMYIYQATLDELIPIQDVDQLVRTYCSGGAQIRYSRQLNEHIGLEITGYPAALAYLSDRIAGRPAPNSCF